MQPVSKYKVLPDITNIKLSLNLLQQQQHWYAVYTRPRHEKTVYAQLQQEKIEAYLPLQTTIRQWSDRKKKISVPLFSGYLFVNITAKEYYTVLQVTGVVRYISFEGKAVAIPEKQIRLMQNLLEQDLEVSEIPEYLPAGIRVEIKAGPLIGLTGELIEYAGKKRVVIRIEEICRSISVNVPLHYLALAR